MQLRWNGRQRVMPWMPRMPCYVPRRRALSAVPPLPMPQPAPPLLAALVALALPLALPLLSGCREREAPPQVIDGDAELGKAAIARYGCGSCHFIPGVPGAAGRAAQPLLGFADRADIAGSAPNTYKNLVTWVQRPQDIAPRARMPSLNVSEKDARDIAAYLLSLKAE